MLPPPLFSLPPPSVFRLFSFCSPLPLSCGCPLYVAPCSLYVLPSHLSCGCPLYVASPPPHLSCRCPLYVASLCCPPSLSCGCSLSVPPPSVLSSLSVPPSLCLKCPVVLFLFPPPSVLSARVFSLCFPLPLSCGCSLDVTLLQGRGGGCSLYVLPSHLSHRCPLYVYVVPPLSLMLPPLCFQAVLLCCSPPPLSLSLPAVLMLPPSLSCSCSLYVAPFSAICSVYVLPSLCLNCGCSLVLPHPLSVLWLSSL